MSRLGSSSLVVSLFGAVLFLARSSGAASLKQVTDLGSIPTSCKMYVYVPDTLATSPGILVLPHSCQNTAEGYFGQMEFSKQADKYGFILIYPESPRSNTDSCWDVNSADKSLKRDGGGDSQSIALMVKYAIKKWNADPKKVFSAGGSSGAMITNVLLATYPDVFSGGSAFAGVPYYCFVGSSYWNNDCSGGTTTKTGKEWGDLVRKAYPDYTGPRPRMQLWHGTSDTTLDYHNFGEEIKQWTNVLGVSETPTSTLKDTPKSPWTRTLYTDTCGTVMVEGNSASGQTHSIQVKSWAEAEVSRFFGLDGKSPINPCDGGTTPSDGSSIGDGPVSKDSPIGSDGAVDMGGIGKDGATGAGGTGGSGGSGKGGATGAGGAVATGGIKGTGGKVGSGGSVATGTGGAGTGGATSTGGTTGNTSAPAKNGGAGGTSSTSTTGGEGAGCSCRIANTHESSGTLLILGLLGTWLSLRRRTTRRTGAIAGGSIGTERAERTDPLYS